MPITVDETTGSLESVGGIRQVSPGTFIRTSVNHQYNIEVLAGLLSTSDRMMYAVTADLLSTETPCGLLVVLSDRLIYVRTWLASLRSLVGAAQRPTVLEVSLESLETVAEARASLFANNGKIVLTAAGTRVVLHVSKKLVAETAAAIREAWHLRRERMKGDRPDSKGLGEQLVELSRLFASGVLSEAEFSAAKQRLLS